MITFNWVISQMDCKPKEDSLTDVVVTVHWRRNATDLIDDKEYYSDIYGSYSCGLPSGEDFTPYEDLTFDQVCGWLHAGLPVDDYDLSLTAQIEQQINPPIIVLPLPWATTNSI